MNRVILLIDTGKAVVKETAKWFLDQGDTVYIGGKTASDWAYQGMNTLEFDPMCPKSLAAAVKVLEVSCGKLDILVLGTYACSHDPEIGLGEHNYEQMLDTMMVNVYGNLKVIEGFEPLLRLGMRRIAGITDIESSNAYCTGADDLGYQSAAAAFNMMGKVTFNRLRPEGFTFRWYCDDGKAGGMCAAEYIVFGLCYDPKEPYTHSAENSLNLRDAYLREIPW